MPSTVSQNNTVFSWINRLYDLRSNTDRVWINEHEFITERNKDFVQFSNKFRDIKLMRLCATGLKFHYAIAEQDLVKATQIIAEQADKHDVYAFKVIRKPFSNASIKQQGKDFTIYMRMGQDTPEKVSAFLNDLEAALERNNIRPNPKLGPNIYNMDRPVKGSRYAYYRFDHDPKTGDYVKGNFKVPEGYSDPLQYVEVSTANGTSANKTHHERALQGLNSYREIGGVVCYDNVNAWNAADRRGLMHFLQKNNITYKIATVVHSDGSKTAAIRIEEKPETYLKKLETATNGASANKIHHERALQGLNAYREIDGAVCYDNVNAWNVADRRELMYFLQKNNIPYKIATVVHRNGSKTTAIRIEEKPEIYLKKLETATVNAKSSVKTQEVLYKEVYVGTREKAIEIQKQFKKEDIKSHRVRNDEGDYYVWAEASTQTDEIFKRNGINPKGKTFYNTPQSESGQEKASGSTKKPYEYAAIEAWERKNRLANG